MNVDDLALPPRTPPSRERRPWRAWLGALGRSWRTPRGLPPGELIHLDSLERHRRTLLLELAAEHGPVFKGLMENRLAVCVVDLALGRRLLKEHAADLQAVTLQVGTLFPHGLLRQMQGDAHRGYRQRLVQGLHAAGGAAGAEAAALLHDDLIADGLAAFAAAEPAPPQASRLPAAPASPHTWAAALSLIASGMLLRECFGVAPGTPAFERLLKGWRRLGPHGVAWHIGAREAAAFEALRNDLRLMLDPRRMAAGGSRTLPPELAAPGFGASLLGRIAARGEVDDTLLGNLIYMVEMGRYDLRGLLRWLAWHAARHPQWLERIAAQGSRPPPAGERSVAEAFVLETLRMDQSERLMRNVQRDIVFAGHLIPRGALVRVCLWEAHKSSGVFAQPFRFDPGRFIATAAPHDAAATLHYAPFGLDAHRCPFGGLTQRLGAQFLRVLARDWHLLLPAAAVSAEAVRGPYHWEPAPEVTPRLHPRSAVTEPMKQ